MARCKVCASPLKEVPTKGPHFAKLVCELGHFNEWVPHPKPAGLPDAIAGLIVQRRRPSGLVGSPAEVADARRIRFNMSNFARKVGHEDFARLLDCITDPDWFIRNKGKYPPDCRWPRVDQMEAVTETEGATK